MKWWARLALRVVFVLGIFLPPLRSVVATVPVLLAYDVTAQTATAALRSIDAVRPRQGGRPPYAYDAVHVGYDGAATTEAVAHAIAVRAYGPALNFRNRDELGEGAIYDAAAPMAAAEGVNPNILSGHGEFLGGELTVPEGTSVTVWTEHGGTISDARKSWEHRPICRARRCRTTRCHLRRGSTSWATRRR